MRRAVLGDEHVERAITRTTDFTVTQAVLGFTSEVKRSDTPTPSGPAVVVVALIHRPRQRVDRVPGRRFRP
ncbi:hypothetical protein ACFCXV_02265, partial [Streptomyces sp. NPDC056300]